MRLTKSLTAQVGSYKAPQFLKRYLEASRLKALDGGRTTNAAPSPEVKRAFKFLILEMFTPQSHEHVFSEEKQGSLPAASIQENLVNMSIF